MRGITLIRATLGLPSCDHDGPWHECHGPDTQTESSLIVNLH